MKQLITTILRAAAAPALAAALVPGLGSCNDFLDATPDSRITVDTPAKIQALLTTAYPQASYVRVAELASDNADDINGESNGYYDRFSEQCFRWQPVSESDNESPAMIWQDYYAAIGAANEALVAISRQADTNTAEMRAYRGEALLCRAFAHFMLTNIFAMHYSKAHAATDPGVPYTTAPETTLDPKYDRGTVAHDYECVERDLQEGLRLMSDAIYKVPRYHFNAKAAYTFASRFYLFCQKPDSVIKYSTLALGSNPEGVMRDYGAMAGMPTDNMQPRAQQYASSAEPANFLLLPVYSTDQFYFAGYSTGARFNNNHYIGQAEQFFATPWAPDNDAAMETQDMFRFYWFYTQLYDKFMLPHTPAFFEEENANTHTGYYRTVAVALKSEEALLNRAEAYALTGQLDKSLADINLWTHNFIADSVKYNTYQYDEYWNYIYAYAPTNNHLTLQSIRRWAEKYDYYRPERPMPRKRLNPDWIQLTEGSDQENVIQTILLIRRIEFLHEGMRWFDIKRYGMKIYRRKIITALNALELTDSMEYRDPRQAVQLPFEVRAAGLEANPRSEAPAEQGYAIWTKTTNGQLTLTVK